MAARTHESQYIPVHAAKQLALAAPGAAPDDGRLETRVTTLEHQFLYLRRDADEIKIELRELGTRVGAVETAIGTLNTKLDAVTENTLSRIDSFEKNVDLKFAAQGARLHGRMDSFEERVTGRMDAFEERVTGRMDSFEERTTGRMDAFEVKMVGRMDTFEEKIVGRMDTFEEKIVGRMDTFEGKIVGRMDTFEGKILATVGRMEVSMKAGFDRIDERFKHVPTNLQLALWGGGFMLTLFLGSIGVIAFLLRLYGQPAAAGALEAMMGK